MRDEGICIKILKMVMINQQVTSVIFIYQNNDDRYFCSTRYMQGAPVSDLRVYMYYAYDIPISLTLTNFQQ